MQHPLLPIFAEPQPSAPFEIILLLALAAASAAAWDRSIAAVEKDLGRFKALLAKPDVDLYKPFRWGTGQNLLREAYLIADHQAYHIGELVVLRRLLGAWK